MTKAQPHKERAHAKLAPSASHRWIECPGSINATEGIEGKSSFFANEGTAAHELAAQCLNTGDDAKVYFGRVIDITAPDVAARFLKAGAPLGDDDTRFEVDEEMVEGVQTYLDYVRDLIKKRGTDAEIEVETRLDMRHVHPSIFGTGDTTIYTPSAAWVDVIDFKYGRGVVVEVDENPQLLTYGTGTVHRLHNRQVKGLTLHIVQPRAPHKDGPCRSWDADLVALMEFEDDLAKAAKATESTDAPRKPGHWCNFCPALPTCPEAREKATAAALDQFRDEEAEAAVDEIVYRDPHSLTGEELARVLGEADYILTWVKSVQAYAHEQAVAGKTPPGYKLVQKRAMRKWIDEDEAMSELAMVFGDKTILTEPKMKSPAQLEKAVGKRMYEQAAAMLVHKVSSGTNLVPVTDMRPAAKNAGTEDFA
jgi:hypothetical protein